MHGWMALCLALLTPPPASLPFCRPSGPPHNLRCVHVTPLRCASLDSDHRRTEARVVTRLPEAKSRHHDAASRYFSSPDNETQTRGDSNHPQLQQNRASPYIPTHVQSYLVLFLFHPHCSSSSQDRNCHHIQRRYLDHLFSSTWHSST